MEENIYLVVDNFDNVVEVFETYEDAFEFSETLHPAYEPVVMTQQEYDRFEQQKKVSETLHHS